MDCKAGEESPFAAEVTLLRERVLSLEAQLAAGGRGPVDAAALLDAIPAIVFSKARDHRYTIVNQAYAEHFRVAVEAIVGKRDEEIFPPETARVFHDNDEAIMESGVPRWNVELPNERADGSVGWTMENDLPLRDESGRVIGMVGVVIDVTSRKLAEEALRLREAELRAALARQEVLLETILALSAPVLPIDDHLLVLPLVGHIDGTRGARILEALLEGVQRYRAEVVILDLTGVPFVDTAVADLLLRATRAVALLGAQCILVGLSPAIARSLSQTGVELAGLITLGDLQTGIRYALKARSSSPRCR